MADLRVYFAQRIGPMLGALRQLVELESPSTNRAAVNRLVHVVAEMVQGIGGAVSSVPGQRWGDHLVCRWGEGPGGFLVLAHLDTVWAVGTLRRRPWHVEDGRAYGPGSLDDKAGVVIALAALSGLRELGLSPRRPVTVLFNTDEEVGSPSSRQLIEEEARRAGVVFCMEPALADGGLKVWRKGTGRYEVIAHGRAAHSGSDHALGVNAIEELAHQIVRLQQMTDYTVGTTVNVGRVRGGTRTNVVPDRAQAVVDVRVETAAEGERIDRAIRSLQPVLPGARLEIRGGLSRPPMPSSPVTVEPFRRVQAIAREMGLVLGYGGSGGASDANFTAALGIPTVDGLGACGDGAHREDEFVTVASLPERAALLAALFTNW